MTKTEHYDLPQWEPTDRVLREDFNEAMENLETALTSKIGIIFGSYTGNDVNGRTINLGFTPVAVYLCEQGGLAGVIPGSTYCYGGLMTTDLPIKLDDQKAAEIVENGFKVYSDVYIRTNFRTTVYYYIAFR